MIWLYNSDEIEVTILLSLGINWIIKSEPITYINNVTPYELKSRLY